MASSAPGVHAVATRSRPATCPQCSRSPVPGVRSSPHPKQSTCPSGGAARYASAAADASSQDGIPGSSPASHGAGAAAASSSSPSISALPPSGASANDTAVPVGTGRRKSTRTAAASTRAARTPATYPPNATPG
ncbi:hypothetical protein GCM10020254_49200 [Streptomyces goshikiensis]